MNHFLSIPNAKPATDAQEVRADLLIAMLRSCHMDPHKALGNQMAVQMSQAWMRREWSDEQFRRGIGNLLILNPSLRIGA